MGRRQNPDDLLPTKVPPRPRLQATESYRADRRADERNDLDAARCEHPPHEPVASFADGQLDDAPAGLRGLDRDMLGAGRTVVEIDARRRSARLRGVRRPATSAT